MTEAEETRRTGWSGVGATPARRESAAARSAVEHGSKAPPGTVFGLLGLLALLVCLPAPPAHAAPDAAPADSGAPLTDTPSAPDAAEGATSSPDAPATAEPPGDASPADAPAEPSSEAAAADDTAPPADAEPIPRRRSARPTVMSGIRIYGGDGRCLAVHGDRWAHGAPVVLAPCHGRADQRWSITPGGRIRGARGYCLDLTERPGADDAPVLPGADVIMTRCDGREDDQTFTHNTRGELWVHDGACVGLDHAGNGPVTRVEIRPCDGSPDQQWSLGTPPAPRSPIHLTRGDGDCPDGHVALPIAEARGAVATLCSLLPGETTARLADGGALQRSNRGCALRERVAGPLAHTLCRPRAVKMEGRTGSQK